MFFVNRKDANAQNAAIILSVLAINFLFYRMPVYPAKQSYSFFYSYF